MIEAALASLDWLLTRADLAGGHFAPIGNQGFYRAGRRPARFDQQPIEAQTTIAACIEAYRVTGNYRWRHQARRIFQWFLGRNDVGMASVRQQHGRLRRRPFARRAELQPRGRIDAGLPPIAGRVAPAGAEPGRRRSVGRSSRSDFLGRGACPTTERVNVVGIGISTTFPSPVAAFCGRDSSGAGPAARRPGSCCRPLCSIMPPDVFASETGPWRRPAAGRNRPPAASGRAARG